MGNSEKVYFSNGRRSPHRPGRDGHPGGSGDGRGVAADDYGTRWSVDLGGYCWRLASKSLSASCVMPMAAR